MGKLLIGLVIGLVVGAVGALTLGGGAMMGAGAAAGLSTGICSVVEAADQSGVLTSEQIDDLLSTAASNMTGQPGVESGQIVGSAEQCTQIMDDMRAQN